jgi:signal transduction histidine kinase
MTSTPPSSRIPGHIRFLVFCVTILLGFDMGAHAESDVSDGGAPAITNIADLRIAATSNAKALWPVCLKGTVLWVSPADDQLIVQDSSGGAVVKMRLPAMPEIVPGDLVMIRGDCQVGEGGRLLEALVDNDGVHASIEKSGTVFLAAGLHPVTVEWFNNYALFDLEVDYKGPGIDREPIPAAILVRNGHGPTGNPEMQGLDYRCYEGIWDQLPDFSKLPVVRTGVVTNFTLQPRTRDECVGLVYSGYLKISRAGIYTFWTRSDDGSKLFIGEPLHLTLLGKPGLPPARQLVPGRFSSKEFEMQWVEVQGTVTRVREVYQGVNIELTFGAERIYLNLPAGSYEMLSKLLHGNVKVKGIYQNASGVDGQILPSMLIPHLKDIELMEVDLRRWEDFHPTSVRSLAETNFPSDREELIRTSGMVISNLSDETMVIEDEGTQIEVQAGNTLPKPGKRAAVLGWWNRRNGHTVLDGAAVRIIDSAMDGKAAGLPQLYEAIQVKSLSQSEAQRGYPVKITGVITAQADDNFIIQDGTWSIFCYGDQLKGDITPKVGEAWEIDGISGAHFAPDITVLGGRYLGPGIFPEPIQPTRDELINGSLDTQFIELQGVVTAVASNDVTLLTREGEMQFQGLDALTLEKYKDALIRVRGVFIPNRDTNLMLVPMSSPIFLENATASVDEPAPVESFDLPAKHISDLLHFDARADTLRRIKISGQVLHEQRGEYFLTDGDTGARFELREPMKLEPGDLVQVVGFPDVGGPSPILRQAQARVSARANLPEGRLLTGDNLFNGRLDSMMVSIRARLIGINRNRLGETLDLQVGTRSFSAVLGVRDGILPDILPGSLLQVTGVYAADGGSRFALGEINSFTLLLDSPSTIKVLERPSWWTVRHALIVVGGMLLVIFGAMIWITLLHRQVEERSLQLALEIKGREQAEYQRALEAERTRIAQDLHDELGATLTEVRFLGAVKSREPATLEDMRFHLKEVSEKSRHMVSLLDEIVWAVNPANDSLPNLANYLCHVAEEFVRTANMRCRLDVDDLLPAIPLTSEMRHSLYLIVREALNNAVKHSEATETWLRIHYKEKMLSIIIEDNGRGFIAADAAGTGNGLPNMRSRIEKIGGFFECDSKPGKGTIFRIQLPLF